MTERGLKTINVFLFIFLQTFFFIFVTFFTLFKGFFYFSGMFFLHLWGKVRGQKRELQVILLPKIQLQLQLHTTTTTNGVGTNFGMGGRRGEARSAESGGWGF